MRRIVTILCILLAAPVAAQTTPSTFEAKAWSGVFAHESARTVPANRQYPQSGYWHFLIDSELITAEWLALHHFNADGASYGANMIIADFMYDGARRRQYGRSAFMREVDDPAEFGCGRAPGVYPNGPDLTRQNDSDHVVCIIGSQQWTHNGFSNYTNAIWLLERRGFQFRTTTTDQQAVVRLEVSDTEVEAHAPLKATVAGGNVPFSLYDVVVIDTVHRTEVTASCHAGDRALAIYPSCDNGWARNWRPLGVGGGEVTCSEAGYNRITLLCASY